MAEERIAYYSILEKLGEGGMGVVYKARDTRLERLVALKTLPLEKAANPERRLRLVREAKAASALNHPNIATVYDLGESDGWYFIAMEYVKGRSLDRLIPRKGMGIGDVLRYSLQISDALACAHRGGVIHRDLKPQNIMVTDDGMVKVVDFGLAKLVEPAVDGAFDSTRTMRMPDDVVTQEGNIVGTVAYMSPEQAEGQALDGRSDIFSMGCVLYEMLTGRRAFEGATKARILSAILTHEPPPVGQIVQDIPPELERIVSRCLRKDPARRFQHMDDLKVALEELRDESVSVKLAQAAQGGHLSSRARYFAVRALLAGLVALVGWLGWLWWLSQKSLESTQLSPPLPVTAYPSVEESVTVSPDGSQVAFSGNVEASENYDIYVKLIGSEASLRLTRDPDRDEHPVWSPDGRWIAFTRAGKKIILVSPLGGPERLVAEGDFQTCAWSIDSKSIVATTLPPSARGIVSISIATGEQKLLVRGAAYATISHDGRKMAYVVAENPPRLYVAPISAGLVPGEARWIDWVKTSAFLGCAWTEHTRELICAVRDVTAESSVLWRIDTEKPSSPQLVSFSEGANEPAISVTAHRLLFDRYRAIPHIWRAPNAAHAAANDPANRFVSSTRADYSPQYSPDGSKIAFRSTRSGQTEIWLAGQDGSNPRMLTSEGRVGAPRWAPDGGSIVFSREDRIYTVGSGGGTPKEIALQPGINASSPSYSSDGRWIYFESNHSGTSEVWRTGSGGGPATQITKDGGSAPVESPNGKLLFYVKTNTSGSSLWSVDLRGGPERQVVEPSVWLGRTIQFELANGRLYYIRYDNPDRPMGIDVIDFNTREVSRALTINSPQRSSSRGLAISPDGKWLLYSVFDFEDDVMQFENFR